MGLTRNQIKCAPVIDWRPLSCSVLVARLAMATSRVRTMYMTFTDWNLSYDQLGRVRFD